MSVLTILVPIVIALIAMFVHAAISGVWTARSLAAMFCFALVIALGPVLVKP